MHCPSCKSEYRPGITRCATCDVELEDELGHVPEPVASPAPTFSPHQPDAADAAMVSYCGFLSLDDARAAREQLRDQRIPSEILIRDEAVPEPEAEPAEEYWLRVPANRFKQVERLLGFEAEETRAEVEEPEDEDGFACSDCGKTVAEHEDACPHCGAKFDE